MSLSVAVIGCGPGGIAASMALRSAGSMVTCFELGATAGGIWNAISTEKSKDITYVGDHAAHNARGLLSPIYSSMRCVLPKDLMAFEDRAFPVAAPQFPHHSVVKKYLQDFCHSNGVSSITRFNTKVESVRWDYAEGGWKVLTVNVINGDVLEWTFDGVVVATGQHHQPRFPPAHETPLAAETVGSFVESGGLVVHATGAKDMRGLSGKRVIVVGDGVGAYDYCREIMRAGGDVVHSTLMSMQPDDSESVLSFDFLDRLHAKSGGAAADAGAAPRGDMSTTWFNLTVATLVASLPFLRGQQHRASELLHMWLRFRTARVLGVPRFGRIVKYDGRRVVVEADPTAPRSSDEIIARAAERTRVAKARARALERRERRVAGSVDAEEEGHFDVDDADTLQEIPQWKMLDDIDAVVFCTGYELSFPFLDDRMRRVVEQRTAHQPQQIGDGTGGTSTAPPIVGSPRGLFMGTVLAANPSIAFLGTQQELLPPFLLLQAQARFVAAVFSGRYFLPTRAVVTESAADADAIEAWNHEAVMRCEARAIAATPGLRRGELYSPRGLGVSSVAYHDMLARELHDGGVVNADVIDAMPNAAAMLALRSTHSLDAALAAAGVRGPTYLQRLTKRRWASLASGIVAVYHKGRSLAPLQRKKQHILFSNDI